MQHVDELIAEFTRETDHAVRCRLLELIGDARDAGSLPVLVELAHGDDGSLRALAVAGLERLDTKAARFQLGRVRAAGLIPMTPPHGPAGANLGAFNGLFRAP